MSTKAPSEFPVRTWSLGHLHHLAIVTSLTVAFIFLCATWSVLVPPLISPDETAHFSTALMLADEYIWPAAGEARQILFVNRLESDELPLPAQDRATVGTLMADSPGFSNVLNQMTQHPPLYYLLVSSIFRAADVHEMRWDQALLLMRLVGVLLAVPLVPLAYATVRVVTQSPTAGLIGATTVFLVPGMNQMVSMANNDTLAISLGALLAFLTASIWVGDRRKRVLLAAGLAFGLAGLAKGTLIVFAVPLLLALLFGRGHPKRLVLRIRDAVWPLGISLVAGQWWLLRNLVVSGTIQPYGYMLNDTKWDPGDGPDPIAFALEFFRIANTSFWGWFGRVNVPLPAPLVLGLTCVCVGVIGFGLVRAARRERVTMIFLLVPSILALILMIRVSWGAYVETSEYRGMHGRYFYPTVIGLITVSALAATALWRSPPTRTVVALAVVGASAVMATLGPALTLLHFYGGIDLMAVSQWAHQMSPISAEATVALTAMTAITGLLALALVTSSVLRRDGGSSQSGG